MTPADLAHRAAARGPFPLVVPSLAEPKAVHLAPPKRKPVEAHVRAHAVKARRWTDRLQPYAIGLALAVFWAGVFCWAGWL